MVTANTPKWQQAVYAALSEHLTVDQSQRAAELWQTRYAGGRSSTVVSFIRELGVEFNLDSKRRHEIRSAIYRAMVHGPAMPTAQEFPAPQAYELANCIVRSIVAAAQAAGGAHELHQALAHDLSTDPDLKSHVGAIERWVHGETGMPKLQEVELVQSVHLVYVACCRALGPVAGDRILRKAASDAETLPAASRFPVARLLYPARPR